jgi:hypothetical protein
LGRFPKTYRMLQNFGPIHLTAYESDRRDPPRQVKPAKRVQEFPAQPLQGPVPHQRDRKIQKLVAILNFV